MIKIETNNGYLDLYPSTQFTYVIENPFFEEEDIFSAPLTLPFDLPWTPNNAKLLGYAFDLQVSFYPTAVPVILYVEGIVFFRGQLNVWRPGNDSCKVSLSFNKMTQDTSKSIREFDYGGERTNESLASNRDVANTKSYPNTDFIWPQFWNINTEDNDRFFGLKEINYWGGSLNGYVNKEIAIPMPFLLYVIKQLLLELGGIRAEGRFLQLITDYVIYNPIATNTLEDFKLKLYTNTDPTIHQFNATAKEMEIGIDDASTYYDIAAGAFVAFGFYEWTYSSGTWNIVFRSFTYTIQPMDVGNPQVFLQNIFTQIQTLGTFTMVDDQTADPDNPRFVMKNATRALIGDGTWFLKEYITYNPVGTITYFHPQIAKHLPDISVSDFINAIKEGFNVSIFLNPATNVMTFTPRKDYLLGHEVKNYTSKMLQDYEKEVNETKNYRFVWMNDQADAETNDRLTFRWHANNHPESAYIGTEELELPLATTKNELQDNTGAGQIEMPKVAQKMGIYTDEDLVNFTFRILKWKGNSSDSFGGNLPLANDEDLSPNEMFNLWFKDWYRVTKLGRDYVNFRMNLSLQDLLHFDPSKKWRVLHNNYIWKKLEVPISMSGIGVADVQLMRINNIANIFSNSAEGDVFEE